MAGRHTFSIMWRKWLKRKVAAELAEGPSTSDPTTLDLVDF